MKGGLSVQHFRIDKPRNNQTQYPPLLHGTKQLIIKRPRVGFLSNEPRIFFGDNTKIDSESYYYYTYVCKNNDYDINNLISFRKLEDSIGLNPPQIRELTLNEVKEIPPQILLGFYTQYIDRCKDNFLVQTEIDFSLMYMRRLFFYLFYHILPVITLYILNTYVNNIQLQDQQNMSNLFNKIKKDNQEVQYFMNIINFLKRINQQQFIDEIKLICDLNQEQYDNLSSTISNNLKNFDKLSPQNEVTNIRQSITQSIRESIRQNNIVGNMVISSARTGVGPMELVEFIGFLLLVPFRIIRIFACS